MHSAGCVFGADAAWVCNVLQGPAGLSDTIYWYWFDKVVRAEG